jgi:OOP family OmpA-OmpF porin
MSARRWLLWSAAIVVALSGSFTGAAAQGWLVGGSAGVAKQYDYSVGGEIATHDDTDTAYRVFGGYMFSGNFGAAVSYVDLGTPKYDGPAFGGFTDQLSADGWDASFIAGWAPGQQKRFSLIATVGAFFWKQDVHYVDPSGTFDYNDSGTSLSYSAGAEFNFGGAGAKWGAHFDYQVFMDVGDENNSGHQYDRSFVSLGVDYRFGK